MIKCSALAFSSQSQLNHFLFVWTLCIQLLAGTWELDWNRLLQTPLSLTPERLWNQLSSRSEFRESSSHLSEHDTAVVTMLSELFQLIAATPLH